MSTTRGFEPMRRRGARAMWIALLMAASGCSLTDVGPRAVDDLDEAWELWERVRPTAYVYGIERLCFCSEEGRGPVRVTVSGTVVTDQRYIDSGDPVPELYEDLFPSVDGLFAILRDAYERDAHSIDVTYDPQSGVPTDFFIDYLVNVADEELGFRLVESVQPR